MAMIERRLEEWKRRLLDLSGRNPLLYFGRTRRTAVQITAPVVAELFDKLIEGKRLRFPEPAHGTLLDLLASDDEGEAIAQERARPGDLETRLEVEDLQRKLNRLRSSARDSIEEQGINTLYLAFGLLEWREADAAEETVRSPLVLMPVSLRYERNKPFTLEVLDEDVTDNAALKYRLELDFHARLPALPDAEELTGEQVLAYLADVERLLRRRGWRVLRESWLSIFSFESLVLYRDIADHTQLYLDNPVLQWLAGDNPPENPESPDLSDLDGSVPPTELFPILDCDDSQLEVMLRARAGQNLVVHGPPGTGKSQTISNLIAQSVRDGKTVLFVSRKMAALEVVHDRLEKEDLGDLCLEVHSHRSNKKDVIRRLNVSLERGRFAGRSATEEFERLGRLREQLNAYAKVLRRPADARARCPYDVYGVLAKLHGAPDVKPPVTPKQAFELSPEREETLMGAIRQLSEHAEVFDNTDAHPWHGAALRRVTPQARLELADALRQGESSLAAIEETWRSLADLTGLGGPTTAADVSSSIQLADHLASAPRIPAMLTRHGADGIEGLVRQVSPTVKRSQQMAAARTKFSEIFSDEVLELDVAAIAERYETRYRPLLGFVPLRLLLPSYRQDASTLRSVAKSDRSLSYRSARDALSACVEYAKHRKWLTSRADSLREELGWLVEAGPDSDWQAIRSALEWLLKLVQSADERRLPGAIGMALEDHCEVLRKTCKEATARLKEANDELETSVVYLVTVFPDGFDDTPIASMPVESLRQQIAVWLDALDRLDEWAAYLRALDLCEQHGVSTFIADVRRRSVKGKELPDALSKALASAWMTAMYDREPVLAQFDAANYERLRDEFRALDKGLRRAAVHWTLARATEGRPEATAGAAATSEVGILRRQGQLQRRHQPLRRLFAAIPTLLPVLKPCLLMSPLSVASYLPPDIFTFDLVVFDEASQIPPEEAVGAIVRGQQIVVAGDERQLPPTSFFRTLVDQVDTDDEEEDLTPLTDSILELCVGLLPESYLRWHYRSKHESLIAFSNKEFYDGRLITFPSPDSAARDGGVRFLHVPDGIFDRGASKTNRREARRVAEMVIEHFREYPARSLGVIAMSVSQQEAIEHELLRLRLENPDLEEAFAEDRDEHFFVKNLERVQGDERDSIIISLGYGPDDQRVVRMQFGPLSRPGGQRRLNVAVTRGKLQTTIVSSLLPPQLDLSRLSTGSRDVALLQRYMEYAANGGRFPTDVSGPAGEPQSDFEEAVLERLRREGLEVDPQVGASSFRIDLGVRHPDRPARYILGVECDGATFHRTMSARERDRLRQEVLESLGWRIFRIWSPDWFRDPDRVVSRITAFVEELRRGGEIGIPASNLRMERQGNNPGHGPSEEEDISRWMHTKKQPQQNAAAAEPSKSILPLPKYRPYRPPRLRPRERFYESPIAEIAELVLEIATVEAPVHTAVVAQRVADVYGLGRVGRTISKRVSEAIATATRRKQLLLKNEFLWLRANVEARPRAPALGEEARRIGEVAREEIAAVAELVLKQELGMPQEDLVRQVARALGYDRVGHMVAERIESAVTWLLKSGRVSKRGNVLALSRPSVNVRTSVAKGEVAERRGIRTRMAKPRPAMRGNVSASADDLRSLGLEIIDKRAKGGALWVVGGKELAKQLTHRGFKFAARGSRTTKHRPAWYLPGNT